MTYPNALVMGYLKAAGQLTPEWRMKLDAALSQGFQRLLTFQQRDGGFAWYGSGTSSPILTAYGLAELTDMNRVYPIDDAVIGRAKALLASRQNADGSWSAESRWWRGNCTDLAATAYVTWAILETGAPEPRGVAWIESHLGDAKDPYTLALAANALVPAKSPAVSRVLAELEKSIERADTETLALATLALLRAGSPSADKALGSLVRAKDPQGGWSSTQATTIAIKALLEGASPSVPDRPFPVTVRVNGQTVPFDSVTAGNFDVLQQVNVTRLAREGDNEVEIVCDRRISAQVAARCWIPWSLVPARESASPLQIETRYDKERLTREDRLRCDVTMRYSGPGTFMVIADLGIPPGFDVDADSFERLLASRRIDKYSLSARQITLYFGAIKTGDVIEFAYDLRPKFPIAAKAPPAEAWEYYAPERRGVAKPVTLEVRE